MKRAILFIFLGSFAWAEQVQIVSPLPLPTTVSASGADSESAIPINGNANGDNIIVSAVASAETFTAGTNFGLIEQVPTGASLGKLGYEDWIQTSATATTAPWTISASDIWEAAIAFFIASGAVATVPGQAVLGSGIISGVGF
jgi:hypothetical protein